MPATPATSTEPKREASRQVSRHILPDGRNSLRAHFFGPRQTSGGVISMWLKMLKPEVWPVIICVAGGVGLAGYFSLRHLRASPDVKVSKVERKSTIRDNQSEGESWIAHRKSMTSLPGYVDNTYKTKTTA